jgi:hypothetical protein
MTTQPPNAHERLLLRDAERHFDYHNFNELLEIASSTCLRQIPDYSFDQELISDEQRVILMLGVRGLNNALDTIATPWDFADAAPLEDEASDDEGIDAWLPLRAPDIINGRTDLSTQRKIERFGTALLDEAYVSLGTDVGMHIARFKDAKTADEQIAELEWLDERIKALSKRAPLKQDGSHFYHPLMLSTSALGQYPHHNFEPTCLGKSILTSSFVYQTGANALHAGVIQTASEDDFNVVKFGSSMLKRKPILPRDSEIVEKLNTVYESSFYGDNDPGFHAATLVQLLDNNWYIIDPNYGSVTEVYEPKQEEVQKAFDDITELAPIARGIERRVHIGEGDLPEMLFYVIGALDLRPDIEQTEKILAEVEADTVIATLREWLVTTLDAVAFDDEDKTKLLKNILEVAHTTELEANGNLVTMYEEVFSNTVEDYLLWGMSPDEFVYQLQKDEVFRNRRVEDLRALPSVFLFALLMIDVDIHNAARDFDHFHDTLEVGNPNYRIGAAVLSDFATYCGDNLSYAFWAAHWSSLVPLTERLKPGIPDYESGIVSNNIHWLEYVSRYTKQDGIVKKFLSDLRESDADGS